MNCIQKQWLTTMRLTLLEYWCMYSVVEGLLLKDILSFILLAKKSEISLPDVKLFVIFIASHRGLGYLRFIVYTIYQSGVCYHLKKKTPGI